MHQDRISEKKSIVGVYCIITRGANVNQRWTVTFLGEEIGRFRTRTMAKQYAEKRLRTAMDNIVLWGAAS
jgi:hypothetical protein